MAIKTGNSKFDEIFSELQYSGESEQIEAKDYSGGLGKSFLKTVSAFCNEPGIGCGYILIGLKRNNDPDGEKYLVIGVSDPEELKEQIAAQCLEGLSVRIDAKVTTVRHPDGPILMVKIDEVDVHDKPVFIKRKGFKKGSYRRIGPTNRLCTLYDIRKIYTFSDIEHYDRTPLRHLSLSDFDPEAIKEYRQIMTALKGKKLCPR